MLKMYRLENTAEILKDNGWIIGHTVFCVYLLILSVMDIRKRKLRLEILLAGFPAAAVCGFFVRDIPIALLAAGGAVGVVFLIISRTTEESLGYGDSILITVLGIYMGFWNILTLLVTAFFLGAVFSGVMLVRKKYTGKSSFPFVPFLTAAYVGGVFVGMY